MSQPAYSQTPSGDSEFAKQATVVSAAIERLQAAAKQSAAQSDRTSQFYVDLSGVLDLCGKLQEALAPLKLVTIAVNDGAHGPTTTIRIATPRLADPSLAANFEKEVMIADAPL